MTIKEELLKWLSDEWHIQANDNTIFLQALGVYELDAMGFFEEFGKRFNVEMSSADWQEYDHTQITLFAFWFRGLREKRFTIEHLVSVIERKTWFDPLHNP